MTTQYFAYRIFSNQHPGEFEFKQKEEVFIEAFDSIMKIKKNEFKDHGHDYILYYIKGLGRDIHVLQLARKHIYKKPIAGERKIEEVQDVDYPNIYLIFHLKYQLVLIQKDTSVFQDLDAVSVKLQRFFVDKMSANAVVASFIKITDQRDFWTKLEELEFIEKVELVYAPPNFFGGKNMRFPQNWIIFCLVS